MCTFIKKSIGALLCMSLLLGMNVTAFAKTNPFEVSLKTEGYENTQQEEDVQSLSTRAAATPVYRIEIGDPEINDNNHIEIEVKVWGYGQQKVTFNGVRVYASSMPPIYEGGVQVGIAFTYDCGEVPAPGKYEFVASYTDYTSPYRTHTARSIITVS